MLKTKKCPKQCVVPIPCNDNVYKVYESCGPDSKWVVCSYCKGKGRIINV